MGFFSDATLSKTDRLVLFVLLVYCISGGILGFMMHNADRFPDIVLVNGSLDVLVVLSALAALWYGSRKGAIPLGQVGFSLGKGMWVNLGVIACCTALFWRQLPPTPLALSASSPWQILGAFIEEVVFRVYLIRILSLLISPGKDTSTGPSSSVPSSSLPCTWAGCRFHSSLGARFLAAS